MQAEVKSMSCPSLIQFPRFYPIYIFLWTRWKLTLAQVEWEGSKLGQGARGRWCPAVAHGQARSLADTASERQQQNRLRGFSCLLPAKAALSLWQAGWKTSLFPNELNKDIRGLWGLGVFFLLPSLNQLHVVFFKFCITVEKVSPGKDEHILFFRRIIIILCFNCIHMYYIKTFNICLIVFLACIAYYIQRISMTKYLWSIHPCVAFLLSQLISFCQVLIYYS